MALLYRTFTRVSDNRRLQPVLTSDGPFNVSLDVHVQNIAFLYSENVANISGVEVSTPPDLTGALPCPVTPLSPDDQERVDVQQLKLPSFAQIDTIIANISSLADAKVVLARLAKIVRVLAKNTL